MSEYPKQMVHPHAKKAVITTVEGHDPGTGRKFMDYHGTPDKFPPLTVTNLEQEERHRAMGYILSTETVHMTSYQPYPMWMTHPDHDRADVLVTSDADRDARELEGYAPPGQPDPDAVERAGAAPYDPDAVVQEYPKVVHGVIVDPTAPSGFQEFPKWIGDKLVNSAAEERALLAATQAPAVGDGKMVETKETGPNERELILELRAEAIAKGIKVDGRWKAERLQAEISAAG